MAARCIDEKDSSKDTTGYKPMHFQEDSITQMVNAASAEKPFGRILADEMGLGKTSQILETIRRLLALKDAKGARGENVEATETTPSESKASAKASAKTSAKSKVRRRTPTTWKKNNLCYLILAPKSVMRVWKKEAQMVSPELGEQVHICDEKLGNSRNVPNRKARILITTTGLLRTAGWAYIETKRGLSDDEDDYDEEDEEKSTNRTKKKKKKISTPWFYKKVWDGVVVDEAHECLANGIRCTGRGKFRENYKMKTAQCIYSLRYHCSWLLTGTPIKNKLSDLVALAKFLLTDKHPRGNIENWNTDIAEERKAMIRDFAKEFMIRRVDDMLNLPAMVKEVIACPMSSQQKRSARQDMHTTMGLLAKMEKAKSVDKAKFHMAILAMIGRLRLNNNSPLLLKTYADANAAAIDKAAGRRGRGRPRKREESDDEEDMGGEDEDNDGEITFADEKKVNVDNGITPPPWPKMSREEILKSSPKIEQVVNLTEKVVAGGEQILIFSFSVQTLKMLAKVLALGGAMSAPPASLSSSSSSSSLPPREPPIFTGKTSGEERESMITQFQAGKERILLLSSKAGGLGITLTAATHVVLLDPWWHPFVEFQAIKRAHRKGQTKTVHMHRFFVQEPDSIDMWMLGLQKSKLEEAKLIMPDLGRYSDCFLLEEKNKVNLVAEFRNWIIQWVGDLGEETKDLVRAVKEKEKKVKAKAKAKGKRKGKRKLSEVDADEYDEEYFEQEQDQGQEWTPEEVYNDPMEEGDAVPEPDTPKDAVWSCSACTLNNDPYDTECLACHTQREGVAVSF